MKTIIRNADTLKTEDYPVLKINGEKTFVVLFSGKNIGVVVHVEKKSPWKIGHSSGYWVESSFTIFDGVIEIQN